MALYLIDDSGNVSLADHKAHALNAFSNILQLMGAANDAAARRYIDQRISLIGSSRYAPIAALMEHREDFQGTPLQPIYDACFQYMKGDHEAAYSLAGRVYGCLCKEQFGVQANDWYMIFDRNIADSYVYWRK